MKKLFVFSFLLGFSLINTALGYSSEYNDLLEKGHTAYYVHQDLEEAVNYYEQAYEICPDTSSCISDKYLLLQSYLALGGIAYEKEDTKKAIKYYEKALNLVPKNFDALVNLGTIYMLTDTEKAESYIKKAKDAAVTPEQLEFVNNKIDALNGVKRAKDEQNKEKEAKANSKTNDEYNYKQYYLEKLNIYEARKQLTGNLNTVTIAIIDDGVYVNHPDLSSHIRTNWGEFDGNGIDDDKNGYIDDYNGRNFVTNSKDMTPTGEHGTMVAGIIGAISNNSKGIAGIIPNNKIKLMPLIVFDKSGNANHESIIKAINYAIDNGANIINLSLGGQQFQYTDKYDEVFKKAFENNVIIVVSAGNGDDLTNAGINTSTTKLSPACNGNKNGQSNRITVASLDGNGNLSKWSNYGFCIDAYAFGENIYTTTISNSNAYTESDGTSFSAPMISAIIGLGYIKYGELKPNTVYYALKNSFNLRADKYAPDALVFLNNLGNEVGELIEAVKWMYDNNLTKFNTPGDFMYTNGLRRDEASKFFVRYAEDILGKSPDKSKSCNFKDLNKAWPDLKDLIIESCQLGLFQGNKGNFMPTDKLTNAQAITVFIRMLEGYKDESGSHFANLYYDSAHNRGLLSGTSLDSKWVFDELATRGDVALMLYRGRN